MQNKEEWKEAVGTNGVYEVSNLGRIRNKKSGHIKSVRLDRNGYFHFTTHTKNFNVHRLVGLSWIPNPNNYPVLNHINGIKTDNRVENLEWCTISHNVREAYRLGLNKGRPKKKVIEYDISFYYNLSKVFELYKEEDTIRGNCKTIHQIDREGNIVDTFPSIIEASIKTKINRSSINDCLRGRKNAHYAGGYLWEYA